MNQSIGSPHVALGTDVVDEAGNGVDKARDGQDGRGEFGNGEFPEAVYVKYSVESAAQEGGERTSAEKLAGRVLRSIRRFGYLHSTECHCTSDGSTVILSGTVPSFYDKVMFQTIASKVPDVRRVINQLMVVRN